MNEIIENKIDLTKPQKEFCEFVLGDAFPWFYCHATEASVLYTHILMRRNEHNEDHCGIINSNYYQHAKTIFDKFCSENDIKYSTIFRSSLNSSTFSNKKDVGYHRDHFFDHNIFILYMSDTTIGNTFVKLNDKIIEIKPEKNKCVIFPGVEHTHSFCADGERRVVMVFTFR